LPSDERGENVLDVGFGREFHRRIGDAKPLRAQPDLGDSLFAGHIDDPVPLARQRGRRLGQQRRFADARIAADKDRRAAHETAAGRAVEFADARCDARRVFDVARQRGERHRAAFSRRFQGLRTRADAASGAFLDKRVPLAACIAFAGPALMHRAAILADELECA
jgi:hypothetical protein